MANDPVETPSLRELSEILARHPEVMEQLKGNSDAGQVAQVLTDVWAGHGIAFDGAALRARLTHHLTSRDIDDEELEQVAGGSVGGAIVMSVLGFLGVVCGILSAAAALAKRDCGEELRNRPPF